MFSFVFIHLGNHILGLVGIEAMEAMRSITTKVIHSFTGSAVLLLSVVIHFCIAMRALYQQPFNHLPRWQQLQIVSGILMLLLLIPHVVPVRGFHQGFKVDTTYPLILQHIWLNLGELIRQFALVIVAWLHLCLGLHYWLKTKRWYRKNLAWLYALAVLWPTLALIGFIQAGYESFDYDVVELNNPQISHAIETIKYQLLALVIGSSLLMLVSKSIRKKLIKAKHACHIVIAENKIKSSNNQSILNALRFADHPHASVCGGRARCTTCRVRVNQGVENLTAIGELENIALKRIKAPPNVRLACQAKLNGDVNLTALLPCDASLKIAHPRGGVSGDERQVVAMFIDLRESTKLAEHKLPYDVLFLLNEFFTQMSESLKLTQGHYAQFAGDGLMALYGLNSDLKTACNQALQGSLDMLRRLDEFNIKMKSDLERPLKIGIGLHCGDAIVGTMGPPNSPNYSAIGDNINIAARLEAQTKELDCTLVASKQLLEHAEADYSLLQARKVTLRGRENEMAVYCFRTASEIESLLNSIQTTKPLHS